MQTAALRNGHADLKFFWAAGHRRRLRVGNLPLQMSNVFRYSRLHYIPLFFLGFVCFILVKGFFYEAFPVENYIYSTVLVLLATIILGGFIEYWRNVEMCIITDASSIEIRKPFNSVKLRWEEISEFGKYRRIAYGYGGGGYWVYYIKGMSSNKRTTLGSKGLRNLEDLVPYILFKAYKAKIVNIQKAEKITN